MPYGKSNKATFIYDFGSKLEGMLLNGEIIIKKIYEDNLDLFPEGDKIEGFVSFIKKLRNYSALEKAADRNEVLHILFQLNLDSISLECFFNIIGLNEASRKESLSALFEDFKLSNQIFRDFILQKRIIPNQNEELLDLLISKINNKIECLFKEKMAVEIRNLGGLSNLTPDEFDKRVPILLDEIKCLIKDELILILNKETEIYLPLESDNRDLRRLKEKFYINLFASLIGKSKIFKKKLDTILDNYLKSETHKWEQLIPDINKRNNLKIYLKRCLGLKVIQPCVQHFNSECSKYLEDKILVENSDLSLLNKFQKKVNEGLKEEINEGLNEEINEYKQKLDICKKNVDEALQKELVSEIGDHLAKQAALYLPAEKFLIFFALLKYEINDFLKKNLDQDSFEKIDSFADLIRYFNFQEKDFICKFKDLDKKGKEQEAKSLLLENLEDLFLPHQGQVETEDKLKSNDSGSDIGVLPARTECMSSESSQITASPRNVSTVPSSEEMNKNSLACDPSSSPSKTQIEMNENKNQAESKDKLKSNDSKLSMTYSSSSRKRLPSDVSLYTVSPTMKTPRHAVDEKPPKKKSRKGLKSKFSKWACRLTCGIFHPSKKTNLEEEAYRPVIVKSNQAA